MKSLEATPLARASADAASSAATASPQPRTMARRRASSAASSGLNTLASRRSSVKRSSASALLSTSIVQSIARAPLALSSIAATSRRSAEVKASRGSHTKA